MTPWGVACSILSLAAVVYAVQRSATTGWRALVVGAWLVTATLGIARGVADGVLGVGVNLTILYHALTGLRGAGFAGYTHLITLAAAGAALAVAVAVWGMRSGRREAALPGILALATVVPLAHPAVAEVAHLAWLMRADDDASFIAEYRRPHMEVAAPRQNLVWIYLEGLDAGFLDEDLFPGLAPELRALAKSGVTFTDVRQHLGSVGTIGGLVSTQCGVPLIPDGRNHLSMGQAHRFLPHARCLGDVLSDAGYRLLFAGGADVEFSGKGKLLREHGYDRVLGAVEFQASGRRGTERAAQNSWGLYDDVLFNAFLDEVRELSETPPWAAAMLTIGTHDHQGNMPPGCLEERYTEAGHDNAVLDAVHCTSRLLGRWLARAEGEGLLDDTLVVVGSDHLMSTTSAAPLLPKDRRNLLVMFGAGLEGRAVATPGAMLDVGATVLDAMGTGVTELGLGRSLLSGTGSLALAHADKPGGVDRWIGSHAGAVRDLWRLPDLRLGFARTADGLHVDVGGQRLALPVLAAMRTPLGPAKLILESPSDMNNDLSVDFASLPPGAGYVLVDRCRGVDQALGDVCLSHGFVATRERHVRAFPPGARAPGGLPFEAPDSGRRETQPAEDYVRGLADALLEDVVRLREGNMLEVSGLTAEPVLFGTSPTHLDSFVLSLDSGYVRQAPGMTLFALEPEGGWRAIGYAPRCARFDPGEWYDQGDADYWRDFEARARESGATHFVVMTGAAGIRCTSRAKPPVWGDLPMEARGRAAWVPEWVNYLALFSFSDMVISAASAGQGNALLVGGPATAPP